MSWDLKSALSGGGAVLAAVAFLLGGAVGEQAKVVERVEEAASSPAGFECPAGYEQTRGVEPETQAAFVTCDNGRYILTKQDGKLPVAFDTLTGRFIDVESLP